jgi:hypothetical protein
MGPTEYKILVENATAMLRTRPATQEESDAELSRSVL